MNIARWTAGLRPSEARSNCSSQSSKHRQDDVDNADDKVTKKDNERKVPICKHTKGQPCDIRERCNDGTYFRKKNKFHGFRCIGGGCKGMGSLTPTRVEKRGGFHYCKNAKKGVCEWIICVACA
jgi:hypothetical protein